MTIRRSIRSYSSRWRPSDIRALGPGESFAFANDIQSFQVMLKIVFQLLNFDSVLLLFLPVFIKLSVARLDIFLLKGHALEVLFFEFLQLNGLVGKPPAKFLNVLSLEGVHGLIMDHA